MLEQVLVIPSSMTIIPKPEFQEIPKRGKRTTILANRFHQAWVPGSSEK